MAAVPAFPPSRVGRAHRLPAPEPGEWNAFRSAAMAPFRLPPLAPATAPLLATVSVLHALEPVAARLRAVFGDSGAAPSDPDGRLEREGRLAVFEGTHQEAQRLERALGALGLTTSINLRPLREQPAWMSPPALETLQESRSRP